nr:S24 family peptidase [Syntrophales bacterium]
YSLFSRRMYNIVRRFTPQVDGEWTMKYFTRTKGGAVVLESANPKYPPIRAREEMKIAGIVSAVVRKYHL